MDNTELHYVTYDPDAIWREMIAAYTAAGGEPLYGGDEKEILLRGVLAAIVQVFAGVDNALRMQTLRYAVGDYLDLLGEKYGVQRIQNEKARAVARVNAYRTPYAFDVIPAGTVMTADGVTFYETVSEIRWEDAARETEIVATEAGTRGNTLRNGDALFLTNPIDGVASFVAITDATGGTNKESDNQYRKKLYRSFGSFVTTGTAAQYESVALNCSQQIIDVVACEGDIPRYGDGDSTVEVYLLLPELSIPEVESIIQDVTAAITDANRKPLSDIVSVMTADKLSYLISINYVAGTATPESVRDAVNQYYEWQNTKIGRAFNPDRLVSLLYNAGCERVTIDEENSHFDGGVSIEYTEIEYHEACYGSVWTEAVSE